jgi:hypothetical protein
MTSELVSDTQERLFPTEVFRNATSLCQASASVGAVEV